MGGHPHFNRPTEMAWAIPIFEVKILRNGKNNLGG
jgi:hypothetical protein